MTEPLKEGPYISDWSTHQSTKAGQGVGAFFSKSAAYDWLPLSGEDDDKQSRFYHLKHKNQNLLLGIFYAPHARKSQQERSSFYETLLATWTSHLQALPGAARILAGDTNLPELKYDSKGVMTPTDSISRFWCEHFMREMACANCYRGKPSATHRAGNTLDLIIHSPEMLLQECTTEETTISDHSTVTAKFQWGYRPTNLADRWLPAKEAPQQQFDKDMAAPLAGLHEWVREKMQASQTPTTLAQLTDQYAVLMGAIIKGIMWKRNSKYGRFVAQNNQRIAQPWWNAQCAYALQQTRQRRGKASNKAARIQLKRTIAKAKLDYWRAEIATITKKTKTTIVLSPQLHNRIQKNIKSKLKASSIIKVKGETLSVQEAISVWTGYLAAQVSWQGPQTPDQILKGLRSTEQTTAAHSKEFDDQAHEEAVKEVRAWTKRAAQQTLEQTIDSSFSYVEYCEAQATMNAEANTSPTDGLPMLLPLSQNEIIRSSVLGLLNLCYVTRHLPYIWRLVPILPIQKPNKPASDIENHRPISLFAALLKVYDKLLFLRTWPHIRAAVFPWQGGGIEGADLMAWLVNQIFTVCRRPHHNKCTIAAFIDGQSAFCRPPWAVVIQALIRIKSLQANDILAIKALISKLKGQALILGGTFGLWNADTGLPQGGSLSFALYVSLLIQLHDALAESNTGKRIQLPNEEDLVISLMAYIDDMLLMSDSPQQFQKSLDLVTLWAQKIRMRINIGPEKSAVMIINDQGLDTDMRDWRIGARLLPIVHTYKYMGQALQVTGRWDEWLKTLVRRTKLKTAELVRWARANHITIDILAPLWTVYVEKAAEWGLASTTLTTTQIKALDTAQRMAARQILGHSSTSPWPSPCLELGWQTWSSQIAPQKMRLYKRLLDSDNRIVKAILVRSRALEQGWLAETEEHIKAAFPQGLPKHSSEWRQHSRQWEAMQKQSDREHLIYNSQRHQNLAHYSPQPVQLCGGQGINPEIHHHTYNNKISITISRLLCGGQGLKAGDPQRPTEVCMRKACTYCLSQGQPKSETLWHFLHECPLTATARQSREAKLCWAQPDNIPKLHLTIWSRKQIRTIRTTIQKMWQARQAFNASISSSY